MNLSVGWKRGNGVCLFDIRSYYLYGIFPFSDTEGDVREGVSSASENEA